MTDNITSSSAKSPQPEELEDLLLSCRYGDIEDVQAFVKEYGSESLVTARDDRGNTVLHMCCGNGHADVLKYLLPLIPSSLLQVTNESKSPPLHWAITNNKTDCVKILCELPESEGGGLPLLRQTNASGRDAFFESVWAGEGCEEVSGWLEGYLDKLEGPLEEEAPATKAKAEEDESLVGNKEADVEKEGIKEEEVDGETVEKVDLKATVPVQGSEGVEEARKGTETLKL